MKVSKTIINASVIVMGFTAFLLQAACAQSTILVESATNALALQVNNKGDVNMIYFGKKLSDIHEYNYVPSAYRLPNSYSGMLDAAYTPAGSRNLMEPAISVVHADGNTSLDLRYVSHDTKALSDDVQLTEVKLKDPVYDFYVTLYYKVYVQEDVIEQWTTIEHQEKGTVELTKFASANLHLSADAYWLTHYHGDWAKEMRPEVTRLNHGILTLDSKLGTRANLLQPSVFKVGLNTPAAEEDGDVLLGALEWSGNFRVDFEVDFQDNLRLIAGMNNFASEYYLPAGEKFETPKFLYVLSHHGEGAASRKLHDWARKYKLLDGEGNRLTLLNNWESTYFSFDEQKLFGLLKDTKALGVDLFLLDDGWFGNKYPRNNDHAGLGDWQANKAKLPNGVASLVKQAEKEGVKFGIWVEPEMVNPKSELYENHPDWVIKQPKRKEQYFRNQLVLDLSNPEVQDFVYHTVDELFSENPGLAFIKWDCNAVIFNAYSAYQKHQTHLYIEYVQGLYKVLKKLRNKYPQIPMMLCSGGGGRVDYAALQYFTEFWASDNTDPLERIFIQWQYSYFYPAIATANHVTGWGKQPLKYKIDVAMMGKMGFDIVVHDLPAKDLAFCKQAVAEYDNIKDVVWHGDQYRLSNPYQHSVASIMYLDKHQQRGVIFNYLVNNRFGEGSQRPIRLKGLEPSKKYIIKEINMYPDRSSRISGDRSYSGEYLMTVGFNPRVDAWRSSVVCVVEAAK